MCHICPEFKLEGSLVDGNQAKLHLHKSLQCRKVSVEYIAIIGEGSQQQMETKKQTMRTNKNGDLLIPLPKNTTSVKFFVCIKFNCNNSYSFTLCLPQNLSLELLQPQLSERLCIENCCRFTVDASGYDHANAGEQLGPCRASRAIAIVFMAMFETYIGINGGYQSYLPSPPVAPSNTHYIAIAQAMHDALVAMFPSQATRIGEQLAFEINNVPEGPSKTNGLAYGSLVASAVLALRSNDGADSVPVFPETSYDDYIAENPTGNTPGLWTKDPISKIPVALGYKWSLVQPFVMESADQFRCPDFPELTSPDYAAAYNEVKALGGDGVVTTTIRSQEHTHVGIYWAYDGVPNLCAPPRMYNQISMYLAIRDGIETPKLLRMLTLINIALADAGIACWDSKYHHKTWRPVTGIRETHYDGTSAPDGNPGTVPDPNYTPLGAPATNSSGVDFTPPFPAYPSGHATFGGALFQMLRNFYGTDSVPFTFVSDELNGVTEDSQGNVRPLIPRSFTSFSQAEEENGKSRVYLGIHWAQDSNEGLTMGNQVADLVYNTIYAPIE